MGVSNDATNNSGNKNRNLMAACISSNSADACNNNLPNSSSSNSNLAVACDSSNSTAACTRKPAGITSSGSRDYSNSNKGGTPMVSNMEGRRINV